MYFFATLIVLPLMGSGCNIFLFLISSNSEEKSEIIIVDMINIIIEKIIFIFKKIGIGINITNEIKNLIIT